MFATYFHIYSARMGWIVSQQVAVLNRLKKILPFELRIDIYIVLSLHRILITAQSRGITVVKEVAPNLKKSMNELRTRRC